jgi:hypothetical protein
MAMPPGQHAHPNAAAEQLESRDLAKLIRKLRWIGMEREAKELQATLNEVPAEKRESCVAGPDATD